MRNEAFVLFENLPVGLQSLAGLDESWKAVGDAEARETWNGTTHTLKPTYAQKWEISLSGSGDRRWLPELDLYEPGSRIRYHCLTPSVVRLGPGDTDAILARDPSPGSVHARDAIDESFVVPSSRYGRTVTIFGRSRHTRVHYRCIMDMLVVDLQLGSGGRSANFNLTMREEFAP